MKPQVVCKPTHSPKIVIIDYFDSLINKLDIYTEEALEKLTIRAKELEEKLKEAERCGCIHTRECLTRMSSRHHAHHPERLCRNRFRNEVNDDFDNNFHLVCPCRMSRESLGIPSSPLPSPDLFNQARKKILDEIGLLQEEMLSNYKSNGDKIYEEYYRLKEERPDYDTLELLKEAIFTEKFVFIITLDNYKSRNKFAAHTIISDFYLSDEDVAFMNKFMNASEKAQIWPSNVLNNKIVLITELCKTIEKKLSENRDSTDILRINKRDVLGMKFLNFQAAKVTRVETLNLPSLRCFALCHNQISYMAPNAFDGMPDLESLFLFSNNLNLGVEHSDLFKPIACIRKINLSFNHVSYLHPNALDNLFNLQDLNLSSNRIVFSEENYDIFDNLVNLNALNIGYNTMHHISAKFFKNLANLKTLVVRGCETKEVDENAFSKLRLLKQIDLTSNVLTSLPKNTFAGLTCLEDINLLNNEIDDLDDGIFDGLVSLHGLWLSTNKLTRVKACWFKSLKQLKDLYIGNNKIEIVDPNSFDDLKCLEKLDISYNPTLKSYFNATGVFSKIRSLKTLNLESDELESINEGLFDGLCNLENLLLARNQLSNIPERCLSHLDKLKKLNLESNCFKQFDVSVLEHIPRVENIILSKNPLENPQILRDHKLNHKYVFTIERQV